MSKSTAPTATKPSKPHPDFPLTPHPSGRWCKKVKGALHYFGPWRDPEAALSLWLAQKDELLAGRTPRSGKGMTCRELANLFLTSKEKLVDSGNITRAHWFDYKATCARMLECFGKSTPVESLRFDDFDNLRAAIAKVYGPTAQGNEIQRVRSIFKWAYDTELLDAPIRFGPDFRKPSKKIRRLARSEAGPRDVSPTDLRKLLAAAGTQLKAMILLGINCGMGQSDISALPIGRIDLMRGWHKFERQKTGIERRYPLWPETVTALKAAIDQRPEPKAPEDAELVFVTKFGKRWCRCHEGAKGTWIDSVGLEFRKLAGELDIGRAFYDLRRTFRTVADEAGDQPAIDFLMGHAADENDMAATYRQKIHDKRLKAVTDHVHKWLFPPKRTRVRLKAN